MAEGMREFSGIIFYPSHGLPPHDLITLPKVSSPSITMLGIQFQQMNLVGGGGSYCAKTRRNRNELYVPNL